MTTKTALMPQVQMDVMAALSLGALPDVHWLLGDDRCDCTFQRIGEWTNPYLAQTLRVRLCCIWAGIYAQFPQFVQEIPAYYDANRHVYVSEPAAWNSEEMDMPVYLWLRQEAAKSGRSLADVRADLKDKAQALRPRKVAPGTGRESMPQPTEAEMAQALEARLRAATWLLDE